MSFFRSSSAAVPSDKNLEHNILLRKTAPPFEAIRHPPFDDALSLRQKCLSVGQCLAALPRGAPVLDGRRGRFVRADSVKNTSSGLLDVLQAF